MRLEHRDCGGEVGIPLTCARAPRAALRRREHAPGRSAAAPRRMTDGMTLGGTPRPVLLVLVGIGSVQLGAAFSKQLFDVLDPTATVWLRMVSSAVILLVDSPDRGAPAGRARTGSSSSRSARRWRSMNWSIYQSFARMPLGLAVTIEFLGPLGRRGAAARAATSTPAGRLLAGLGVALLGSRGSGLTVGGVAVRAARRGVVGGLHPAVGRDRPALAGPVRARDRQRGRRGRAGAVRRGRRRQHACWSRDVLAISSRSACCRR